MGFGVEGSSKVTVGLEEPLGGHIGHVYGYGV